LISSNRDKKEEFLLEPEILNKMTAVRRMFDNIEDKEEATIMVMEQMKKTKMNAEFMKKIGKQ
jgi:transcription termination factor Rho